MANKREGNSISNYVRFNRQRLNMTQEELAQKAGVGLRFIRDMEQGKTTLRMDKVNQVLSLFGQSLSPVSEKLMDPYDINLRYFNLPVKITLKNKNVLFGIIIDQVILNNQVTGWKFVSNNHAIAFKKDQDPKWVRTISHPEIDQIELQD
jgi:y4mF family transcriptional regulator